MKPFQAAFAALLLATLGPVSAACLNLEAEAVRRGVGPGAFAVPLPLSIPLDAATLSVAHDTAGWDIDIRECGATSVAVMIEFTSVGPGWVVETVDSSGLTSAYPTRVGKVQTWPVAGDWMRLRIHGPRSEIDQMSGAVTRVFAGIPGREDRAPTLAVGSKSSAKNAGTPVNFSCKTQEAPELAPHRGGAMGIIVAGAAFCSGSFVNHPSAATRPFLLTAAHCADGVSPTSRPSNLGDEVLLRAEYVAECGQDLSSAQLNGPSSQGVATRYSEDPSLLDPDARLDDLWVVEMDRYPPTVTPTFVYGYSFRDPPLGTRLSAVHHADSNAQQWATGLLESVIKNIEGEPPSPFQNARLNSFYRIIIDEGCVNPGSSGSTWFNQAGQTYGVFSRGNSQNGCQTFVADLPGSAGRSQLRAVLPGESMPPRLIGGLATPTPAPTAAPTATPTPAPSTSPSPSPSPTPTPTVSPTPSPPTPPTAGGDGASGGGAAPALLLVPLLLVGLIRRSRVVSLISAALGTVLPAKALPEGQEPAPYCEPETEEPTTYEGPMARLSVDLPVDLLADLKAHAAQQRTTIKEIVTRRLRAELGL